MTSKIALACVNPRGGIEVPAASGLINPRIKNLEGKTIAIIWDGKKGGDNFCAAIENLLNDQHPEAKTMRLV